MDTRLFAALCFGVALGVAGAGTAGESSGDTSPAFLRLQAALADFDRIAAAGGWPQIGSGPLLRAGERDARVPDLRRRLAEPQAAGADSSCYDTALVRAVRSFQVRHGLQPDGIVGPLTVAALDVPAADRARQVALNLERLRWLPPSRGSRHVLVNVPAGTLTMVAGDSIFGIMRVVVGRPDRPTPTLESRITQLELNPAWNIPQRLARLDVLPHLRKDPEYWRANRIRVFDTWQPGARELDPADIDWAAIKPAELAYKLQQEPGPLNPLGRVKFLFDNPYAVFIHDTPSRDRFNTPARFYSSGCVRIEDPETLAGFLLQGADQRLHARVAAALADPDSLRINLPRPVPVYLVYWTAWVDPDGVVQFRDDVYGHDAELAAALFMPPPAPESPLADGTCVEMDEVGSRIVADTAALLP